MVLSFFLVPWFSRYKKRAIAGLAAFSAFIALGALTVIVRDLRQHPEWIGHRAEGFEFILARTERPPEEKANSFKITARTLSGLAQGKHQPVKGKIFLYLRKTEKSLLPAYGDLLLFRNELQPIRGSGNPGAFDYGRYCILKGFSHQQFADSNDILQISGRPPSRINHFIFSLQEKVIAIIRNHIPGEKEYGLAEALLIGYKNDLDKSLVKEYSDTGVVHIIAISGLHVGLIYWLMGMLVLPLRKAGLHWTAALATIGGLWLFSLLAGAQPSILRAALMFTCMAIEKQLSDRGSTYNTIAFSAFVLLCINPFWLWDAGFQLSYAAVLSIIGFHKPVYQLFYFRSRLLDAIWKMNAVTIAAQILTLPLCIYYFQQFPVYFLFTNFLAVPLSTAILFGEILLLPLSFIPTLAEFWGGVLGWTIRLMNGAIHLAAKLPAATWESLHITVAQALLLSVFSLSFGYGLLERSKLLVKFSILCLVIFSFSRLHSFLDSTRQELLIVYNVPRYTAVDLVAGRRFRFAGDSILMSNPALRELHLDASRTFLRTRQEKSGELPQGFRFNGKNVFLANDSAGLMQPAPGSRIDLLVLSGNPKFQFKKWAENADIRQVVITASAPPWKVSVWEDDCRELRIPCHDVRTRGAFVMSTR